MTIVLNPSHPKAKPKCIACLNLPKLTPYFTHMKMLTALRDNTMAELVNLKVRFLGKIPRMVSGWNDKLQARRKKEPVKLEKKWTKLIFRYKIRSILVFSFIKNQSFPCSFYYSYITVQMLCTHSLQIYETSFW